MSYKIILIFFILLVSTCSNGYSESESTLFDNGIADFQKGRYQEAVFWFTKLIAKEPFNAKAYKNRGVARLSIQKKDMAMGNNEESKKAMEDFNSALKLDPELEGVHSNMGVAWYYAKEYKKAITEYDKEIEKHPENHSAFFNRAISWVELKEYENALSDLQTVLEAKPNEYWAISYQGDIYTKTNNPALARESYLAAIALNTGDEYAQDRLLLLDKEVTASSKIKNSQPFAEKTEKRMAQSVSPARSNSIKTEDTVISRDSGISTSTVSIKKPSTSPKKETEKRIVQSVSQAGSNSMKTEDTVISKNSDIPTSTVSIKKPSTSPKEKTAPPKFTIQLGAFLNSIYADEWIEKLKLKGYEPRVIKRQDKKNRQWTLVRTGGFQSVALAQESLKKVQKDFKINAMVRPVGKF